MCRVKIITSPVTHHYAQTFACAGLHGRSSLSFLGDRGSLRSTQMYSVLPRARGLALGALLLSIFDGGITISSAGPSSNNGCAVYDRFGVLQHDCRLSGLEIAFAPIITKMQRKLLATNQLQRLAIVEYENFTVAMSLTRDFAPGPAKAEARAQQVCIPQASAFPDGQLLSEVCKERLICCDLHPEGVIPHFMAELPPPLLDCSTRCLLRIVIKDNRQGGEQAHSYSQSESGPGVPVEEGSDSTAVKHDFQPTARRRSTKQVDSHSESRPRVPVEEGSDSTAVRHDFQLRLEDVLTSHLLPASSDEDKLGLVPQVHAYGQSKHGEDSDTSPQGNRNVNDIAVDDAAVDDLEETVTQPTARRCSGGDLDSGDQFCSESNGHPGEFEGIDPFPSQRTSFQMEVSTILGRGRRWPLIGLIKTT